MDITPKEIEDYIAEHTSEEPELLQKLGRETHLSVLMPRMLSGHVQGRLLSLLAKMLKPKRVLEIGTYTGYSALCMAEGLAEGGKLTTIDFNDELAPLVRKYIDLAGMGEKIELLNGNAMDIVPALTDNFDLVFIDADKQNYPAYFSMVVDKLNPGGVILGDNVLWSGKVVGKYKKGKKDTEAILLFNRLVQEHPQLENLILPLRDGLMLARKVD